MFSPHAFEAYAPEVELDGHGGALSPDYPASVRMKGDIQPMSAAAALGSGLGLAVDDVYQLFVNPSTGERLAIGHQIVWKSRVFLITGGPEPWVYGNPADHYAFTLQRQPYGEPE